MPHVLLLALAGCATSPRLVDPDYRREVPGQNLTIAVVGPATMLDADSQDVRLDCALELLRGQEMGGIGDYACRRLPPIIASVTSATVGACEPALQPRGWTARALAPELSLDLPADGTQLDVGGDAVLILQGGQLGCSDVVFPRGSELPDYSDATVDTVWRYALWDNQRGTLIAAGQVNSGEGVGHLARPADQAWVPDQGLMVGQMFRGTAYLP
jgi:hypothetical protein